MVFQYGVLLPMISIFLELISSRKEQFDLASLRKLRLQHAFWTPQTGSYGKTSPAPPKARWKTSYHPVKLGHLGIEVIPIYSHRLELDVLNVLLIDVFLTIFSFHRFSIRFCHVNLQVVQLLIETFKQLLFIYLSIYLFILILHLLSV